MASPNVLFFALAVGGLFLGCTCFFLVHAPCRLRAKIGRRLFLAVLLTLGIGGLLATVAWREGLAPLGLIVGLLVVAMCWELPTPENHPAQGTN